MSGPRAVQVSRLLKHLVPLGWESTVIGFGPTSNRYNPDPGLADRLRARGVTLVPVASLEERLPVRALWRVAPPLKHLPDEKRVWVSAATRAAVAAARHDKFSALVSFAQPWSDHLVGLRVKQATGLCWIAHFSDPWSDSPYGPRSAWHRRVWRRMEERVVGEADAVVFVNTQTANRALARYPASWRRKTHVIPHGFDDEMADGKEVRGVGTPLRIVHTGRFYEGVRTPVSLMRALASLARGRDLSRELQVTFVGPIVPAYEKLAGDLGLRSIVEFVPRVPAVEAAHRAADADLLLVVDAPADENLFLPSKLVDYLPLLKPILALTPACGATADVVRAAGYDTVAPDDERAIEAAIAVWLDRARAGTIAAAPQHRAAAERYHIRHAAAAFAGVLAQCG